MSIMSKSQYEDYKTYLLDLSGEAYEYKSFLQINWDIAENKDKLRKARKKLQDRIDELVEFEKESGVLI